MIGRREFIAGLGSAAAWPVAARAQQRPVPVIGFLRAGSNRDGIVEPPFRQGLREGGFFEGQNVEIMYRYADYEFDRLPALAADLVGRRVAVIVAQGAAPALVAKAATTTIPIVFETANDPVASGLVASLSSPGGNMTGVSMVSDSLYAKGVQILHELLPASNSIALLINPKNPVPLGRRETEDATRVLGLNLTVFEASDSGEIERVFARIASQHLGGIVISTSGLFDNEYDFLVTLAARYRVPAMLVADPVGEGFVAGLPRPGGNITGFTSQEEAMAGKWAQLLTEIAPGVKRVAFMFNPETASGSGLHFLTTFETAARSAKVMPIAAPVRNDADIETVITSLGCEAGGGLVVMPDGGFTTGHRAKIILLAAQNNVPALYPDALFTRDGGLLSYGPDRVDIVRRSASYVDRILRGAKPADLPVQLPTKFEMVVNLKTAKALGLTVPQSILLSADEVIE